MRNLLFCFLFVLPIYSFGQIADVFDFFEFCLESPEVKHSKLGVANGWTGVGVDQYSEDGNVVSEMVYKKITNGTKYYLTLKDVIDGTTGGQYSVTILMTNTESVFNKWKADLEKGGFDLVKDPNSINKWAVLNEDDYVIYLERENVDGVWMYEITMIV